MNSTQSNLQVLVVRVERLEASNRRWKFLNALLVLSGVSLLLMGARPADRIEPPAVRASVVEAHEFILKDEVGHVYARLTLNPSVPGMKQPNGHMHSALLVVELQRRRTCDSLARREILWTAPTAPTMVPVR